MKKLSEILKEKIEKEGKWSPDDQHDLIMYSQGIKKGMEIALDKLTPDVTVKFAEWMSDGGLMEKKFTTEELFTEFITNHYKP